MKDLKLTEIIALNNKLASDISQVKPYNIKILYNVTCNQVVQPIIYSLRSEGINPVVTLGGFDNLVQDSYQADDQQLVVVMYDIVGVLMKREEFVENLSDSQIEQLIADILAEYDLINNNLHATPAVVWNTVTSAVVNLNPTAETKLKFIVDRINAYFADNKPKNVTLINLNDILLQVGIENAVDRRMLYSSKIPYSFVFWKYYASCLASIVFRFTGKLKKVLVFDCDNTLWKGILGEDGLSGIDMNAHSKVGQIFNSVQQIAKWLSGHGVIVGLCSKNNLNDVQEVLDKHPDMVLRDENIVIKKVNWNDKASNLREIAIELNVGIDSIVFVDDSEFEISLVNDQLPQVKTFQVPSNLEQYPRYLLTLINQYFYITEAKADLEKTSQYKAQVQRVQSRQVFGSIEDYLKSLDIRMKIKINNIEESERIAQLTQKTNQFNLTTQRYTQSQIEEFMNQNLKYKVYSISVEDKFGDMGLTGLAIVECEQAVACIDTFLMSCRIMGRNIEFAFMDYIVADLRKQNIVTVNAVYMKTPKNSPVENFYDNCGFQRLDTGDNEKKYSLVIEEYKPLDINYIKI